MNKSFLKNASWIIGGRILQMIISFVMNMITARYLGPGNYGTIAYVTSYIAFFTSIASLGLNNTIVNELLTDKDHGKVLGTSILMQLTASFFSSVTIILIVWVLNPNDKTIIIIAVFQSLSLLFQAFGLINYWFQSNLRAKVPTIITLTAYVIITAYRVILLILQKNIIWFASILSIEYLLIGVLFVVFYLSQHGNKFSFSLEYGKNLIKRSYNYILAGIMVAIYGQIDKIMIGKMINTTFVGYYSAAITICNTWVFILNAIIDSARPIIINKKKSDESMYVKTLVTLYSAIIWINAAVSIFICIFGEEIITILFGIEYMSAAFSLKIVTWATGFSYLGIAKNIWLICENKQKYVKYLSIVGAISNVILNCMLIPKYDIVGAAIAYLLTQIIVNFIVSFFIKNLREDAKYITYALIFKNNVLIEKIKTKFKWRKFFG